VVDGNPFTGAGGDRRGCDARATRAGRRVTARSDATGVVLPVSRRWGATGPTWGPQLERSRGDARAVTRSSGPAGVSSSGGVVASQLQPSDLIAGQPPPTTGARPSRADGRGPPATCRRIASRSTRVPRTGRPEDSPGGCRIRQAERVRGRRQLGGRVGPAGRSSSEVACTERERLFGRGDGYGRGTRRAGPRRASSHRRRSTWNAEVWGPQLPTGDRNRSSCAAVAGHDRLRRAGVLEGWLVVRASRGRAERVNSRAGEGEPLPPMRRCQGSAIEPEAPFPLERAPLGRHTALVAGQVEDSATAANG
jgi:hypothetical protein